MVVKQALASSQICAYVFSLYPCLSDLEISDAACIHLRSLEVGEQGIKVLVELDKPLLHISYLLLGPLRLPLLQSRRILQLGQIVDNPEQKMFCEIRNGISCRGSCLQPHPSLPLSRWHRTPGIHPSLKVQTITRGAGVRASDAVCCLLRLLIEHGRGDVEVIAHLLHKWYRQGVATDGLARDEGALRGS